MRDSHDARRRSHPPAVRHRQGGGGFLPAPPLRQAPRGDDLRHPALELRPLHELLPHLLSRLRPAVEQADPELHPRRIPPRLRIALYRSPTYWLLLRLRPPYSGPVANWLEIDSASAVTAAAPVHCAFLNCCTQNPNPASSGSLDSSPR